jgi:tRNA (cmo5U34)-methyltransferase
MKNPATVFDKAHAAAYEDRFAKVSAQRDGLHLLIRILFSDLPANARILCVGAGTGLEVRDLARAFPAFEFVVVEPSGAMLDICRQRAEEEGIAARCTFHEGFIASLPPSGPFHAATCLLVSQFIMDRTERVAFFREIASRLRPGGSLVSADLSADLDAPSTDTMKHFWQQMLRYTGLAEEQVANYLAAWKAAVAVLPAADIEHILTDGGFASPTHLYQSLFIHAWHSRRAD